MAYERVTNPTTGKFLFEYDPERELIKLTQRRVTVIVDLTEEKKKIGERSEHRNRAHAPDPNST